MNGSEMVPAAGGEVDTNRLSKIIATRDCALATIVLAVELFS